MVPFASPIRATFADPYHVRRGTAHEQLPALAEGIGKMSGTQWSVAGAEKSASRKRRPSGVLRSDAGYQPEYQRVNSCHHFSIDGIHSDRDGSVEAASPSALTKSARP